VRINVFLLLFISLSVVSYGFTQDTSSVEDQVIGVIFKNLAKAYITVSDFNRLKKDTIERLKGMDDARFNARYSGKLSVIKEFPQALKVKYGINENMKRRDVIKKLGRWDKKEACRIIDGIPEEIIAKQFKEYTRKRGPEAKKSNLLSQVKSFWGQVKVNFEGK